MADDSTSSEQLSPPSSAASDPSLSRNSSFNSRLNAHAPEFVPTRATTPTPTTANSTPQFAVPPPPPPLLHVYAPPPPPFHAPPIPYHVISPVHPHHHHRNNHYLHHQQQQLQSQDHRRHNQNHHHHQRSAKREGDQQQQLPGDVDFNHNRKDPEDSTRKILNQVEYYFSDLNLATTDLLMKHINKDPEGYVPVSVVASFNKIKAFINSNSHLAGILRNSTKLVVSEDGNKVKRRHPLTESDIEELQSRIVVAENLPEDHSHQKLMKIFSAVGSVKTIRTCHPQTSGGGSSASRSGKSDNMHFNNKLHAFVEYESVELAEKAAAELNEEANWRTGPRVHLMLRRMAKPAQTRGRKGHDNEGQCEEEDANPSEQVPNEKQLEDTSQQSDFSNSHEHMGGEHVHEKEGGPKKGRNKGRGKGRGSGRALHSHNNNHHNNRLASNNVVSNEQPAISKQPPGPRMPDGTRGFSMGRGKPIAANIA